MPRRPKIYRKRPMRRRGLTLYTEGYKKPVLSRGGRILKMYTTDAFTYKMIEKPSVKRALNIRRK